jgi:hypothetical protein
MPSHTSFWKANGFQPRAAIQEAAGEDLEIGRSMGRAIVAAAGQRRGPARLA